MNSPTLKIINSKINNSKFKNQKFNNSKLRHSRNNSKLKIQNSKINILFPPTPGS